jgi:hypothetical protein
VGGEGERGGRRDKVEEGEKGESVGAAEGGRQASAPRPKRTDCKILSIPLGPKVVFTKSAMAMAPIKQCMRAFSP